MGTFAPNSHYSLNPNQTVKQALKQTADKLSDITKNTEKITTYAGNAIGQTDRFAPTSLISTNSGFAVAIQTGENGVSPGIAMGNTSDSGDHSLGSYKNPQIRYDTSTVYTSGNQIGQNAPTLTLLSQQMEFRLTSDADLEALPDFWTQSLRKRHQGATCAHHVR